MMERRRCDRPAARSSAIQSPESSGPRWDSFEVIARSVSASMGCCPANPTMPHMIRSLPAATKDRERGLEKESEVGEERPAPQVLEIDFQLLRHDPFHILQFPVLPSEVRLLVAILQ